VVSGGVWRRRRRRRRRQTTKTTNDNVAAAGRGPRGTIRRRRRAPGPRLFLFLIYSSSMGRVRFFWCSCRIGGGGGTDGWTGGGPWGAGAHVETAAEGGDDILGGEGDVEKSLSEFFFFPGERGTAQGAATVVGLWELLGFVMRLPRQRASGGEPRANGGPDATGMGQTDNIGTHHLEAVRGAGFRHPTACFSWPTDSKSQSGSNDAHGTPGSAHDNIALARYPGPRVRQVYRPRARHSSSPAGRVRQARRARDSRDAGSGLGQT
jgi:hypothetical protein